MIHTLLSFDKILKKLHKNQIIEVEQAILDIENNYRIGEEKKGDLNNIYVYKFKMNKQLTLLAYYYNEETKNIILLLLLGSHQNFYEDLKRLLRDVNLNDYLIKK